MQQPSPLSLIHERPPYPWYRRMRETTPVLYMPQYSAWGVFRYDDVRQVLSDPLTFSSDRVSGFSFLTTIDPPRYTHLRSLVNQAFTQSCITSLAPRIAALAHELLDAVSMQGEMDIVENLAYPLPVSVISEIVGVPQSDRLQLQSWIEEFSPSMRGVQSPGLPPAMTNYFANLIELRRREPQDDLITRLISVQTDGQAFEQQELIDFCFLVYAAGHSTTTDLIGNTVLCLLQHPEIQENLRNRPEQISDTLEEVLRYHPPMHSTSRTVTKETSLGAQRLQKGQGVISWIASANHDAAHFLDPESFNITRSPNRHLSFGHNIHFCPGASLARLEACIALQVILERFSSFALIPGVPLEMKPNFAISGARHIPITFQTH